MGQLLPHTFVATSVEGCVLLGLSNGELLVAKRSLLLLRKHHVHTAYPFCLLTPTSQILFASRQE